MPDIIERLWKFTPFQMLHSFGFELGDERNEDRSKTFFANVPKAFGKGSFDMALFNGQHEPFAVCEEAAKEIEALRKRVAELEANKGPNGGTDDY